MIGERKAEKWQTYYHILLGKSYQGNYLNKYFNKNVHYCFMTK